jgi:hypothetical protein
LRRWLYGIDGRPTSIESKEIEAYLNSDRAGKEYKVAQLFAYNKLITDTLNNYADEIQALKDKVSALENREGNK